MASIRLFGRGRNTAAAAGGAGVSAAAIADVLEGLTAASMSTTWRCRHGGGSSLGEGAVDFAARRSRATVIRGKYAFEYVRSGVTAYRTQVLDVDEAVGTPAADADADGDVEEPADVEVEEAQLEAEDGGLDELDAEAEAADDAGDEEEESVDSDGEFSDSDDAAGAGSVSAVSPVWERFAESDACGVHAYAEPAVLAAGVRAAGVVAPREPQEFDGVVFSAYAVTLKPKPGDPNRVLARLARHLRDHGANVVVVTAFVDESATTESIGDVSDPDGADTDADGGGGGGRIVRLRIELPHWTPADDPTADHAVSVDLFEFGEPVKIDVPQDAARRRTRSCADLALF